MSKKNKIIVSIVGITIVLLALLGLTYAYYLTRIEGNTNTNSISITTADLKLEYGDGNGDFEFSNIMPGWSNVDEPKTFTVTNNGNAAVNDYVVAFEEVTNTLTRTEDLTYELTCVQKKKGESEPTGECFGKTGDFPKTNSIIVTNSIEVDYVHEYTLKVVYANLTDVDQSDDMGSVIMGKVQIFGLADTVDLTGTVAGVESTDSIEIHSKIKTSSLVLNSSGVYEYKLTGVEPGNHTLYVKNKDGEIKGQQVLKINKGEEPLVSTNEITITNETRIATVNIAEVNTTTQSILTEITTMKGYNPFEEGTLAYSIYDNSKNETNGTELVTETKTKPYEIPTGIYADGGVMSTTTNLSRFSSQTKDSSKYYTYADSYTYNSDTKKYTLYNSDGSDVTTIQGFSTLVKKYVVSISGSDDSTVASYENLSYIYYVGYVNGDILHYESLNSDDDGINKYTNYITYADSYEFDNITGTYKLVNSDGSPLKSVRFMDGFATLIGKYIKNYTGIVDSTPENVEGVKYLYKIKSGHVASFTYDIYKKSGDVVSTEKELSIVSDQYGTSYYFRGIPDDNFVEFNNMCFRIVRIQGDGSIKLALAKQGLCSTLTSSDKKTGILNPGSNSTFGYKSYKDENDYYSSRTLYIHDYLNYSGGLKNKIETWFNSKFSSSSLAYSKVKNDVWCINGGNYNYKYDRTTLEPITGKYTYSWGYSTSLRYKNKYISLKCDETDISYISKVGNLTIDEAVLAGANSDSDVNYSHYLYSEAQDNFFLGSLNMCNEEDYAFFVDQYGRTSHDDVTGKSNYNAKYVSARPAITLISGVMLASGDGTKTNPYKIVME